ncbi:unnamed protein product [Dovyalis caffra]|uniref:Ribosomal protein S14 n=1 Tax=Dovyalis caffra TaxID=77055 RepID=A0AAV1REC0_9ROSI|nr:unnamed protein product [Dovyalis caffra]
MARRLLNLEEIDISRAHELKKMYPQKMETATRIPAHALFRKVQNDHKARGIGLILCQQLKLSD